MGMKGLKQAQANYDSQEPENELRKCPDCGNDLYFDELLNAWACVDDDGCGWYEEESEMGDV